MTRPGPSDDNDLRYEGTFFVGATEHVVVSLPAEAADVSRLSMSELCIWRLLLDGLSYHAIAARRHVALSTVSNQVQAVYRKLGVHSRRELMATCGADARTRGR